MFRPVPLPASQDERAHGVTPGLSQDYVTRTADQQAAFVLPYLHPGMNLLDVGCGPGTITLGLAQAVAPGHVTGIDHGWVHLEAARALAAERGVTNVTFQPGNALSLPFEDGILDAAFENNITNPSGDISPSKVLLELAGYNSSGEEDCPHEYRHW